MSDNMNAIDVAYQTEVSIEAKSTEQLAAEVNVRYRQAESLAGMSLRMLADAGMRLTEIKSRIPHGQFEDWCAENLEFSKSKAEKMMKLADKMADEKSLFSKTETFTDIGISRVWALLAAPEEVAAEVIETHDVTDMTVRELKEEISRLKKEKADAEARADAAGMEAYSGDEQEIADLQHSVEHLTEKLRSTEDVNTELKMSLENKSASIDRITEELENTKEKLKKAKTKAKELEAAKNEEIKKGIEEALPEIEKRAREEGAADAAASLAQSTEDIMRLEAEVERLEAEKAKLSNTALMEFKVYVDQLQDIYYKINDMITQQNEEDPEIGSKMQAALQKVVGTWNP